MNVKVSSDLEGSDSEDEIGCAGCWIVLFN